MTPPSKEAKTIGTIAYLTLIGALIAMSMNSEPRYQYSRFHTRQAFGLHLCFIFSAVVVSLVFDAFAGSAALFMSVWFGLYLFYFILWIYGFIAALNGRMQCVPLIGPYFQRWFKFIP